MAQFLLRIGNGNDGNYPTARIEIGENDCVYSFMECVIPNMFIPSHKARSHAWKCVEVDGEASSDIYATLHEGYGGQKEMDAAYKTAELVPIEDDFYDDMPIYTIKEWLDRGAMIKYNQKRKG